MIFNIIQDGVILVIQTFMSTDMNSPIKWTWHDQFLHVHVPKSYQWATRHGGLILDCNYLQKNDFILHFHPWEFIGGGHLGVHNEPWDWCNVCSGLSLISEVSGDIQKIARDSIFLKWSQHAGFISKWAKIYLKIWGKICGPQPFMTLFVDQNSCYW